MERSIPAFWYHVVLIMTHNYPDTNWGKELHPHIVENIVVKRGAYALKTNKKT